MLCGLAGSIAQHMVTGGPEALYMSCGAMSAVTGLASSLLVHRLNNKGMEDMTGAASPYSTKGASSPSTDPSVPNVSLTKDIRLALQGGLVVVGSVLLLALPMDKGEVGLQVPSLLAGGVTGVLLALGQCPKYQVTQEVIIPDGAMIVPEDAKEVVVVVDVRSQFQRLVTLGGVSFGLLAAINAIQK
eukprot:gene3032-13057_t